MKDSADLSLQVADMLAVTKLVKNLEAGDGADGIGHGLLKPPSEGLLEQEAERDQADGHQADG